MARVSRATIAGTTAPRRHCAFQTRLDSDAVGVYMCAGYNRMGFTCLASISWTHGGSSLCKIHKIQETTVAITRSIEGLLLYNKDVGD